jgi:hypothetical protein
MTDSAQSSSTAPLTMDNFFPAQPASSIAGWAALATLGGVFGALVAMSIVVGASGSKQAAGGIGVLAAWVGMIAGGAFGLAAGTAIWEPVMPPGEGGAPSSSSALGTFPPATSTQSSSGS